MHATGSLRSRFALLIALLAVTLCMLLGGAIYSDSSGRIRQEVGQQLADLSYQMIDRLDRDMANRARMLEVLASLNALRQPDDLQQIRDLLDRMKAEFPSVAWTGYLDAQGNVLASSNGVLQGANIALRPVFSEGIKGRFVGDVHEALLLAKLLPNPTGEAMKFVDIALPVKAADGRTVGVLASHLSWAWADEVRRSLMLPQRERNKVEFLVLSRDRSVLLGPPEMIGQHLDLPALDEKQDNFWSVQEWPDQRLYLTGFARSRGNGDYKGLGWTVVTRQQVDLAYAPALEVGRDILIWGAALAVIFAFIGWLMTAYFTRPLRTIAEAADRLSAGEIAVIPEVGGSREIQSLSDSIRGMVESLTQQKSKLGMMESLALHDALTGLPNRTELKRYLHFAQQQTLAGSGNLALLYLDLDGFKPINDRFGHAVGDQLLREVAIRLRTCLRDGDLVARLGGDEFLMVLRVSGDNAQQLGEQVASRALRRVLREPFDLQGVIAEVGCSVGGALWPLDGLELEQVLELADQALYRAKSAGRNRAEFHRQPALPS
jgi:diguanylate cyclase (GGDEF)-like protein